MCSTLMFDAGVSKVWLSCGDNSARVEVTNDMRGSMQDLLVSQYAHIEENIGERPENWAANLTRVS